MTHAMFERNHEAVARKTGLRLFVFSRGRGRVARGSRGLGSEREGVECRDRAVRLQTRCQSAVKSGRSGGESCFAARAALALENTGTCGLCRKLGDLKPPRRSGVRIVEGRIARKDAH